LITQNIRKPERTATISGSEINKVFRRPCCKHKSKFNGVSTQLGQQKQRRFWNVLSILAANAH